jgi:hypothetical protein
VAARSPETLVSYHNTLTAAQPRRPWPESSPQWKPQISNPEWSFQLWHQEIGPSYFLSPLLLTNQNDSQQIPTDYLSDQFTHTRQRRKAAGGPYTLNYPLLFWLPVSSCHVIIAVTFFCYENLLLREEVKGHVLWKAHESALSLFRIHERRLTQNCG